MKNLITLVLLSVLTLGSQNANAQKDKKTATIVIKTSTQCGMCKGRLEKVMAYEKGIISSDLNIEKAEFTVTYKVSKTSPEKIKLAITKVGYDADELKADKTSYDKLPACCQKDGMKHE